MRLARSNGGTREEHRFDMEKIRKLNGKAMIRGLFIYLFIIAELFIVSKFFFFFGFAKYEGDG